MNLAFMWNVLVGFHLLYLLQSVENIFLEILHLIFFLGSWTFFCVCVGREGGVSNLSFFLCHIKKSISIVKFALLIK